MTLLEITEKQQEIDPELTIYAVTPWSPKSQAVVEAEPQGGTIPGDAIRAGMSYFLEVAVARDFWEDLQTTQTKQGSLQECCQRLIDYAVIDA